jgi:ribosomal protein S18 acetylase RimI-like enzyme
VLKLSIRPATLADQPLIADFNQRLAVESEDRDLAADVIGPGVATLLADPTLGRYFMAELAGRVVGQLMITYEWSDWRNGLFWWIQSVYVSPSVRRNGVFSALYQHAAELARRQGACGLRLYVEQDNHRAQKTYQALGLADTPYRVMEVEF